MQQARAKMPISWIALFDVEMTCSKAEDALHHINGLANITTRRKWSEDPRTSVLQIGGVAGHKDTREVLSSCDSEIRIALAIGQQYIETWTEILDQPSLGKQCLPLGDGLDHLDVVDQGQHWLLARPQISGRQKVTSHTVPQRRGLAHVEHEARGILHEVDAGPVVKVPWLWHVAVRVDRS